MLFVLFFALFVVSVKSFEDFKHLSSSHPMKRPKETSDMPNPLPAITRMRSSNKPWSPKDVPMGGFLEMYTSLLSDPSTNNKIEKWREFLDTQSGNRLFENLQLFVNTLTTKDVLAERMLKIYIEIVKIVWPEDT